MLNLIRAVSRFLSTYTSLFVIACAVIAFFIPTLFGWVHGNTSSIILGIIMLSMGLTITMDDVRNLMKRPADIFLGRSQRFSGLTRIWQSALFSSAAARAAFQATS